MQGAALSTAIVYVHVLPMTSIRIHAGTRTLLTGTCMPLYVTGGDGSVDWQQRQSPMAFGGQMRHVIKFDWSFTSPQTATRFQSVWVGLCAHNSGIIIIADGHAGVVVELVRNAPVRKRAGRLWRASDRTSTCSHGWSHTHGHSQNQRLRRAYIDAACIAANYAQSQHAHYDNTCKHEFKIKSVRGPIAHMYIMRASFAVMNRNRLPTKSTALYPLMKTHRRAWRL
jgi:hypothetical protein